MVTKSNRSRAARFTEGPEGQEEWEKWFAKQPSSFQNTWDENTDKYGDMLKNANAYAAHEARLRQRKAR